MFTSQKKYNGLKKRHDVLLEMHIDLERKHDILRDEWNSLVRRVNGKGGEQFLDGSNDRPQFDKGEIKQLLFLCHPDKHHDNPKATEITRKLLDMRKLI
jgi:hypothetical protein